MATSSSSISLMVMYENESVDVRYGDDSRLHLSPCGSEFVLEKGPDPSAHPLQSTEKVRQRTRFAISRYKELMTDALEFRNKYAIRPYLPEELIPADCRKKLFSINSEVEWPASHSCQPQVGPDGETIVSSVEGRASLLLSPSGEEFSVEFTCSLSQNPHHRDLTREDPGGSAVSQHQQTKNQTCFSRSNDHLQTRVEETKHAEARGANNSERSRSCSPHGYTRPGQPEPGEQYQTTRVVQHHSCSCVQLAWCYPLSLALRHWRSRHSQPSRETAEEGAGETEGERDGRERTTAIPNPTRGERRSRLPESLPVRCLSPHQHRWKLRDSLDQGEQDPEQDLRTELVRVLWCQGVVYRIVAGAIPVVEVSPGDGSVIRSNGVLASYFTHKRARPGSGEVSEVTYHLSSLPPDKPGQVFSVSSIVTRASRILDCYNQARHSLKRSATPSCLEKETSSSEPRLYEQEVHIYESDHMRATEMVQNRPSLLPSVAAELEKIRRFNFMLENSNLLRKQRDSPGLGDQGCKDPVSSLHDPVSQSSIAEALQRTSRAIQDIDTLLSSTTLTPNTHV